MRQSFEGRARFFSNDGIGIVKFEVRVEKNVKFDVKK